MGKRVPILVIPAQAGVSRGKGDARLQATPAVAATTSDR
jgi:hypothetical protein